MRALILEDNSALAGSLKSLLAGQGWEVTIRPTWGEVEHSFTENNFKLIVLDVLLPDIKGFDILPLLAEKAPTAKVAIISGLVAPESALKHIPQNIKKLCRFFKKPIEEKAFLDFVKISSSESTNSKTEDPVLESFFRKSAPDKSLAFYFPEKKRFESTQLMPVLFFSHLQSFTGSIKIHFNLDDRNNWIQFYKGKIIKIFLNNSKSFFGELLVEHGLSLKQDIDFILKNEQNNGKKIGEILVEKELLSPQMLNFVLKEQVKIRLSEMMSINSSFELSFTNQNDFESYKLSEIYFNDEDFIDWLSETIQTYVKESFLSDFYWQIQQHSLIKVQRLNYMPVAHQQAFLNEYNHFFDSLDENLKLNKLNMKPSKSLKLRMLYFGLLTKSLYLKRSKPALDKSHKDIELFLNEYLSKSKKEIADILKGPLPFSIEETSKRYKKFVAKIHIDKIGENASQEIKNKSKELFIKTTKVYKMLCDEKQRKNYISGEQVSDLISLLDRYEKGISAIKADRYQEGLETLLKIKDHEQAPYDIKLYILWARMKSDGFDAQNKDRAMAVQINKTLESFPIHLRVSYLFWFVKGLFYIQTQSYEKAKDLFEKTLSIQKDFSAAKTELIFVKQKIRKNNLKKKAGIFSYFKKSS